MHVPNQIPWDLTSTRTGDFMCHRWSGYFCNKTPYTGLFKMMC